jgi:hypothetical protein
MNITLLFIKEVGGFSDFLPSQR